MTRERKKDRERKQTRRHKKEVTRRRKTYAREYELWQSKINFCRVPTRTLGPSPTRKARPANLTF
jgi:hypothetical protein